MGLALHLTQDNDWHDDRTVQSPCMISLKPVAISPAIDSAIALLPTALTIYTIEAQFKIYQC
jgi:hypothetical protein